MNNDDEQIAIIKQIAVPTKMDPINQQALKIMVAQGTYKHMFTHEQPGQTLTYLEVRERYG